ncbi:5-formyltetrahydrofolate cyclo-ligase [Leptothoe sp. PORK10 BA2]|nr:5-formyltetrahydrofolate cyclo-ligase [Leptothoe sp. PORK10 BA2]MEA5463662.1 5-formyltetrahydrofolate cyclo-ligase [Leptothoe sp. PORK10 BA2]
MAAPKGRISIMSETYRPAAIAKIQDQKAQMRRSLLKARQAMPPQVWQQKCDRICTHLTQWPTFQSARTVLAYCSVRNEPDLGPLLAKQRSWGFPRCNGQDLIWHRWFPSCTWPLRPGAYGIQEPDPTSPQVDPQRVDLILVPAVGCDVRGYRLGYGGGFYDRMLSQPSWQGKLTIAIVFEFARLPQVPKNSWDRPLDGICTESGLFLATP